MKIAYVRVSTEEQNEARQVEALSKHGIERWFTEKVSGKNTDRPKLKEMLEFVREGDAVYIHDLSRLARSTRDLLSIVETLNGKGVALVSNKEAIDSNTPTGKLMLTMIGAINEFERTNLLERQREGIEIAKRKGVYTGRKKARVDRDAFEEALGRFRRGELKKKELAELAGVSRPTLNRILKDWDGKEV